MGAQSVERRVQVMLGAGPTWHDAKQPQRRRATWGKFSEPFVDIAGVSDLDHIQPDRLDEVNQFIAPTPGVGLTRNLRAFLDLFR
jgi:hypothetical protein